MDKPETPFPRHWLYYIICKWLVIALAVAAAVYFLRGETVMPRERLYLFDTTLRDGAQTNGVDFTLHDKLAIAAMLDDLGIDYVEGGYPGANPTDHELFARESRTQGHLHRVRHDAAAGPLDVERSRPRGSARRQGRCDLLRRQILGLPRARGAGDHDRRRISPRSATACAPPKPRAAKSCSTASTSSTATRPIPPTRSPARSDAYGEGRALGRAVRHQRGHAAARGRGDRRRGGEENPRRAMSASMRTMTPSRRWRTRSPPCAPARARSRARSTGWASAAATPTWSRSFPRSSSSRNSRRSSTSACRTSKLKSLAHVSRTLDEMLNRAPNRHAPYVGESAFATKAGIHASAIMKEPATYEHIAPGDDRQPAQAAGLRPGRQVERAGRARAHRHQGRQG